MTLAPSRALARDFAPAPERPDPGTAEHAVTKAAVRPVEVIGVLVVHDGAAWLKPCLDALAIQTRPLDRLVIVDTGSTDDSPLIVAAHDRIRGAIGDVRTLTSPPETTFGQAVGRAVELVSADGSPSEPGAGDWLWLLHDDSAAAPDALVYLLDAAIRSPSVGVAGPKLTTWDDPSRLLEVGQQITRSGVRAGGPSSGEPDQGQHDHRTDVLSVNTSGMLVRRDVFAALGGFDPAFGQFRDDLDLSWRAHLAGHRVVVVPRARIREAAASANGTRSPAQSADAARRRDRSHGRQVALARCSPYAVPVLALWIALSSVGSAAALLVVKQPRRAWEQLGDVGSLMTPWHPLAARWRSRGVRQVRRRDLRGLFASPGAGFRHAMDAIHDAVEPRPQASLVTATPVGIAVSAHSLETGPAPDDGEALEELAAPRLSTTARIVRHPGFLAVLVATLLALVTWRSLLGDLISPNGLGVAGGELLPVSTDASGLWHAWLDGWHGAGLGTALQTVPYLPVLAGAAWVLEHLPFIDAPTSSVGVSIAWLLAAAMPLSAFTAYIGARVATRAAWPRAGAALAWSCLGTLTTALASGRLGAVVAHILLPLVAAGFVCATRRSTGVAVTFATALALGVTGVFNPPLALLGALCALVLFIVGHGRTRLRAAVLLLVPAGLLGPWILAAVDNPLLLLGGPGLTVWQGPAVAPWQLALLHPGGPGSYPALLTAPILLAGVVAMVRCGVASRAMSLLAVLAVTGLALGIAAPRIIVGTVPQGMTGAGGPITPWAGTGLDLAALALIAAAVLGLDGLQGRLSSKGFGWRQILVAPVVAAAVVGVVASAAAAGWVGVASSNGDLTLAGQQPTMPAVASEQADGPLGTRMLVLTDEAGTTGYRIVGREPGTVVRDLPLAPEPPDPVLAASVRSALTDGDASSANDARNAFAGLGIGFVAFRGAVTEPLVRRLDATAGMARLSESGGLVLWRVLPRDDSVSTSRLRLVDAKGAPLASLDVTGEHGQTDVRVGAAKASAPTAPAAATDTAATASRRQLVVAEPAAWADHARVTFAGRELAAVAGGDQPTYDIPSSAGQLTITLVPEQHWWHLGQLGLLVVVLFLAAPFGPSRSRRNP